MLGILTATAWAYQPPNSTLGVSVGTPWTIGGRGEAWLADEVSGELGAGTEGLANPVGFDLALRFRPDVLCFACGSRALVSVGVGVGGFLAPQLAKGSSGDPWPWAAGPDVAATFVYWFSTGYGLAVSGRVGAGPEFQGTELHDYTITPWAFGTVGLAF